MNAPSIELSIPTPDHSLTYLDIPIDLVIYIAGSDKTLGQSIEILSRAAPYSAYFYKGMNIDTLEKVVEGCELSYEDFLSMIPLIKFNGLSQQETMCIKTIESLYFKLGLKDLAKGPIVLCDDILRIFRESKFVLDIAIEDKFSHDYEDYIYLLENVRQIELDSGKDFLAIRGISDLNCPNTPQDLEDDLLRHSFYYHFKCRVGDFECYGKPKGIIMKEEGMAYLFDYRVGYDKVTKFFLVLDYDKINPMNCLECREGKVVGIGSKEECLTFYVEDLYHVYKDDVYFSFLTSIDNWRMIS